MSRNPSMLRLASPLFLAGVLAGAMLTSQVAVAADRAQPQASGAAREAPPARPLPDISVNAEEIKALQGKPMAGEIVTRRPPRVLTPMMAEILATCAAQDQEIATKRQQLAGLRNDRAAYEALQQEIQRIKRDGEIELMRIQARYAVQEGRTEDARRIEASIEERLNPKIKLAPESRPVPSSATSR